MNELRIEVVFSNPLRIMEITERPEGWSAISVALGQYTIAAKERIMYTLPVDHVVKMRVEYFDAAGNPAKVDGAVSWESSNPDVAQVQVDAQDSQVCTVTPVAQLGQVQVTASADADIGAGMREVITTADIEVVAGEAVIGTISPVGEPEPKAPTPTPTPRA